MKKLVTDYLTKWYIPVFVAFIFGLSSIYIISLPYKIAFYLALILPFTTLCLSGILGIIRFFKKQYLFGILQVTATTALAIAGIMFLAFHMMFYPYDFYADNLEIPKNLKLDVPRNAVSDNFEKQTDFKLYNGMQPGIYSYDVSIIINEKGTVFLKAFEVTKNDPLSMENLKSRSSLKVNASDTIMHYRLKDDFTIYEGDWSKPYAARFEMWFKSDTTGKETKLTQRIYKIEGWMR